MRLRCGLFVEHQAARGYLARSGFNAAIASSAVSRSAAIATPKTLVHVPVASCNRDAIGPPKMAPIPCAMYRQPELRVGFLGPNVYVRVDGKHDSVAPPP